MNNLKFSESAKQDLLNLENDPSAARILKDVRKALGYMETNLRHQSLSTQKYHSLKGPNGEQVFEAYAQQQTPSAYRIFWYYGPGRKDLSIMAIVPHP
jgi:hypothetical protein